MLLERIKAVEQRFAHLRDGYQKLRNEHIVLLRTNGESQKKLTKSEKSLKDTEKTRTVIITRNGLQKCIDNYREGNSRRSREGNTP